MDLEGVLSNMSGYHMLLILEALVWCFHILDRMSSKSYIYSGRFLFSVFIFLFLET